MARKKLMEEKSALNDKQKLFCAEYIKDLNLTQAAIRAGYSVKTARAIGHNLFTKVYIQEEIQRLMDQRSQELKIDAASVLKEIALIAFSDIGNIFTESGGLKEINQIEQSTRRAISSVEIQRDFTKIYDEAEEKTKEIPVDTIKVKLWNKTDALRDLGRHLKLFVDKIEIDDSKELADKLRLARERRALKKAENESQ